MGNIKVLAGDFLDDDTINNYSYIGKVLLLKTVAAPKGEVFHRSAIAKIAVANEENVNNIAGKAFWGATGAILLGPIGLAAGLLAGGKSKKIAFILEFDDGRTLLGVTDSDTYNQLLGGTLETPTPEIDKNVKNTQKSINGERTLGGDIKEAAFGCLLVIILGGAFVFFIASGYMSEGDSNNQNEVLTD